MDRAANAAEATSGSCKYNNGLSNQMMIVRSVLTAATGQLQQMINVHQRPRVTDDTNE